MRRAATMLGTLLVLTSCKGGSIGPRDQIETLAQIDGEIMALAADGETIVFVADRQLQRREAGGAIEVIAPLDAAVQELALLPGHVLWATEQALLSMARTGGETQELLDGRVRSLIADGEGVLALVDDGRIVRVEPGTKVVAELASMPVTQLCADETAIYGRSATSGELHRIERSGGAPSKIATGPSGRGGLTVDETYLYMCADGELHRLAKASGTLERFGDRCPTGTLVSAGGRLYLGSQGSGGARAPADLRVRGPQDDGWTVLDRANQLRGPIVVSGAGGHALVWSSKVSGGPTQLQRLALASASETP